MAQHYPQQQQRPPQSAPAAPPKATEQAKPKIRALGLLRTKDGLQCVEIAADESQIVDRGEPNLSFIAHDDFRTRAAKLFREVP